jgi:hypothetical protein
VRSQAIRRPVKSTTVASVQVIGSAMHSPMKLDGGARPTSGPGGEE